MQSLDAPPRSGGIRHAERPDERRFGESTGSDV